MKDKKYHYFYKITNLINGFYYYGIHSTDKIDDGYFGSGHRLKKAIKIFGKENFKKEILKYFTSREKCSEYEALVVNENCIIDTRCYNLKLGGEYGNTIGTILTIDENGEWQRCKYDDEDYINGILKPFSKGKVTAFDNINNKYVLIDSIIFQQEKNKRYVHYTKGKVIVKDKNNNYYCVSIDDERYLNGELVPTWKDRKHTKETKEKISLAHQLNHFQQGEKNSQYGTCWIYNKESKENLKIKKEELDKYLNNGYIKGRYFNKYTYRSKYDDIIDIEQLKILLSEGKKCKYICEYFNINASAYNRFCKKHNIIRE